jgi:hypothetical protein
MLGEHDEASNLVREAISQLVAAARLEGRVPKKRPRFLAAVLPLLGSNQDSPDPEGPPKAPEFQQLATFHASSWHPMLEFAGFDARLCRLLLTQMLEFAEVY